MGGYGSKLGALHCWYRSAMIRGFVAGATEMYAIIEDSGRQYKVQQGDAI